MYLVIQQAANTYELRMLAARMLPERFIVDLLMVEKTQTIQ